MGKDARKYTTQTIKKLFALSGNHCAFPGCPEVVANSKNAKNSNICHIEGANEGSERYNPNMTDPERADYANLILLCIQHHDETNCVEKYPVKKLQEMKRSHETMFMNQRLGHNPSMLKNAINAISGFNLDDITEEDKLSPLDPSEKIKYNAIKRNSSLIHEYKIYYIKIDTLYDELDTQGSIKKEKLLNNIKFLYNKIKGEFILDSIDAMKIIQKNSDNIIDKVYDELYIKMVNSGQWDEDVILGIRLIMVDAFMRCKILEEPPKK